VLGGKATFVLLAAQSNFVDQNTKAYAAYLTALDEAMQLINADK
jgi:ABC-type nitrate/sulfonate/bicarbonate transport system substrate-binding protein